MYSKMANAATSDTPQSSRKARRKWPLLLRLPGEHRIRERSKGHVHITPRFCEHGSPRSRYPASQNRALCLAPGPASATLTTRAVRLLLRTLAVARLACPSARRLPPPLRSTPALAVLAQRLHPAHPPIDFMPRAGARGCGQGWISPLKRRRINPASNSAINASIINRCATAVQKEGAA
jgi:hypothetical protein